MGNTEGIKEKKFSLELRCRVRCSPPAEPFKIKVLNALVILRLNCFMTVTSKVTLKMTHLSAYTNSSLVKSYPVRAGGSQYCSSTNIRDSRHDIYTQT